MANASLYESPPRVLAAHDAVDYARRGTLTFGHDIDKVTAVLYSIPVESWTMRSPSTDRPACVPQHFLEIRSQEAHTERLRRRARPCTTYVDDGNAVGVEDP